jgi:hypothetical protein
VILLSVLKEPVERDLSDVYPGFKVVLRRLDSSQMAEARDRALTALRAAREGLEALDPYGLNDPDSAGRRINPLDAEAMARAGELVGVVEVMVSALVSWEGVLWLPPEPEGAKPSKRPPKPVLAPINRQTLSILLRDDGIKRRLIREVDLACRLLVTEGNGSGSSRGGSSGTRTNPPTPAAPPIAKAAARRVRPARKG